MPILNRPMGGNNKIEGTEYTGTAREDIKKNDLCYVQGGFGLNAGNSTITTWNMLCFSWVELDENRVLIVDVSEYRTNKLMAIILQFNDGEDKLTNPFVNKTSRTIYDYFPYDFNNPKQYALTQLDFPDREIFAFVYGTDVYFMEIIDKTKETVFLSKGSLSSTTETISYYRDIFPVPYKYINNNSTYSYLYIYVNGSENKIYAQRYNHNANGSLIDTVSISTDLLSSNENQLLKVFLLPNGQYMAVMTSVGTSTTFFLFYLITLDEITYNPIAISLLPYSNISISGIYINFSCYYKDSKIVLVGNEQSSPYTFIVAQYLLSNVNAKVVGGETVEINCRKLLQSEINLSHTAGYTPLQCCLIHGNYLAFFISANKDYTTEAEKGLTCLTVVLGGGTVTLSGTNRITIYSSATTIRNTKMVSNAFPIVRNDMIYALYVTDENSFPVLNCATIQTPAVICPAIFENYFNLSQVGLAKSDYKVGELATIIHPN